MKKNIALLWIVAVVFGTGSLTVVPHSMAQAPAAKSAAASRTLGTVKTIAGNAITVVTDAGSEVSVTVAENARLIRTAPGQKDLTGASAIQLSEIQIGDRVLLRGKASEDGKSLEASAVIVMKKTDIAEKQAREREDWQKRSVGGPVTAIDPATETITISGSGAGGAKSIAIHTSKTTVVRRYAADSVKFDDAKITTLDQVKVGDQLRARGERSADGSEVTAEELVVGTFRNIAGTVVSTDVANNSFVVTDLATKKPITVKVTADSQLHNLPQPMAMGIAMRLKGGAAANGQNGAAGNHAQGAGVNAAAPVAGGPRAGGMGGGASRGDISQMLSHLPEVTVAQLQKGQAVMIVTTQGTPSEVTAVTMLSGVEPILTASPNGNGATILSPWNLGGMEGAEGAAQ